MSDIYYDVYMCVNGQKVKSTNASRDKKTSANWGVTEFLHPGDNSVSLTLGNGAPGCYLQPSLHWTLYRKSSEPGAASENVHRERFDAKNASNCGWFYQKVMKVNIDGTSTTGRDAKGNGDPGISECATY